VISGLEPCENETGDSAVWWRVDLIWLSRKALDMKKIVYTEAGNARHV
jgi:hypothetical protein